MPIQPYRYTMKQGPYNVPLGQSSDFYRANPYQSKFTPLTQRYGQTSQQMMNPYVNLSPEQMRLKFGYQGGTGPNNPALGDWMAQMRGNVGGALREGVNQQANAGVAASRGGMALPGADLRSVLGNQANQQVAGMASQNFNNAVNYENQRRGMDNQIAAQLADFARTQMNTGLGLAGLELQGTQADQAAQQHWMDMAGQAFGADTNLYNQMVTGEPQRRMQEQMMNPQLADVERQNQLKQLMALLQSKAYGAQAPGAAPWDQGSYQSRGLLDRLTTQLARGGR